MVSFQILVSLESIKHDHIRYNTPCVSNVANRKGIRPFHQVDLIAFYMHSFQIM